jgi:hypothetical protein
MSRETPKKILLLSQWNDRLFKVFINSNQIIPEHITVALVMLVTKRTIYKQIICFHSCNKALCVMGNINFHGLEDRDN